jgi:hypothetical protein
MSLLSSASNASAWRGYEYYKKRKVEAFEKLNDSVYECHIEGSLTTPYHTVINVAHPRQSHCDCPHAKDRQIICKHMVALLFTVFPEEAEEYIHEEEESEKAEKRRIQEHYEDIKRYVKSLKKEDLQRELYNALIELEERDNRYW